MSSVKKLELKGGSSASIVKLDNNVGKNKEKQPVHKDFNTNAYEKTADVVKKIDKNLIEKNKKTSRAYVLEASKNYKKAEQLLKNKDKDGNYKNFSTAYEAYNQAKYNVENAKLFNNDTKNELRGLNNVSPKEQMLFSMYKDQYRKTIESLRMKNPEEAVKNYNKSIKERENYKNDSAAQKLFKEWDDFVTQEMKSMKVKIIKDPNTGLYVSPEDYRKSLDKNVVESKKKGNEYGVVETVKNIIKNPQYYGAKETIGRLINKPIEEYYSKTNNSQENEFDSVIAPANASQLPTESIDDTKNVESTPYGVVLKKYQNIYGSDKLPDDQELRVMGLSPFEIEKLKKQADANLISSQQLDNSLKEMTKLPYIDNLDNSNNKDK